MSTREGSISRRLATSRRKGCPGLPPIARSTGPTVSRRAERPWQPGPDFAEPLDFPASRQHNMGGSSISGNLVRFGALGCGTLLLALRGWLADTDGCTFAHYVVETVPLLSGILLWMGGWVVLTQIRRGYGEPVRHLGIAGFGLFGIALIRLVWPLLASASGLAAANAFEVPGTCCVAAVMGTAHLRVVIPGLNGRLLVLAGLATALLGGGFGWYRHLDTLERRAEGSITGLAPGFLDLGRRPGLEAVLAELTPLEAELKNRRLQPLPDALR